MNVAYLGPLFDYSGYGEANRHAVAALDAAHIDVMAKSVSYTAETSDMGPIGSLMMKLAANDGPYRVKILHTTPDQYKRYMEPGKYHIGHFFWETDKAPAEFVEGLNLMDEIWTGSEANRAAIIRGGCLKPVYVFPQAIETDREWPEKYQIPGFPDDGFLFYSIFEWTDRKNPLGLLNAYWREFQDDEKVGLVIKTYFRDFTLENKRMIRESIRRAKEKSGLSKFPPVYVYLDLMDRKHIARLHNTGDCYVSPHRGEGWGIPIAEAALAGKPIITTGYGGISEWLNKNRSAMILDYKMIPLKGMDHSARWYGPDQNWADPELAGLQANMRLAFERGSEVDDIAKRGQKLVQEQFSLSVVGELMAARLKEIEETL